MPKSYHAFLILLFVSAALLACRDKKNPLSDSKAQEASPAAAEALSPLDKEVHMSSSGVEFQLVHGATSPQPLTVYLGKPDSYGSVRGAFRRRAHLLCSPTTTPSVIRAAIQELKAQIGPHLGSAPISLISSAASFHHGAMKLAFEDPKFFGQVFLLNSASYDLRTTQLTTLAERGLRQLGIDQRAENAINLRNLASRLGLQVELLASTSAGSSTDSIQEVLSRLSSFDPRYQLDVSLPPRSVPAKN